jgi:hydroxyacylglutathione hydrolase
MLTKHNITAIPALTDNYIWAITLQGKNGCVLVDPGESKPAIDFLNKNKYKLQGILVTHHHYDHTDGIEDLINLFPCKVWGASNTKCKYVTNFVTEEDTITIPEINIEFKVKTTPGHTLDHIIFYNDELMFTGDTLFSFGMGRIFEGTPEMMLRSINKIKKMDSKLKIYCGHEYTLSNIEFALLTDPDNHLLKERLNDTKIEIGQGKPTLPSILESELIANPFLRSNKNEIKTSIEARLNKKTYSELEVFTELRHWKNNLK